MKEVKIVRHKKPYYEGKLEKELTTLLNQEWQIRSCAGVEDWLLVILVREADGS